MIALGRPPENDRARKSWKLVGVACLAFLLFQLSLVTNQAANSVVAWGDDRSGQNLVPPELTNAVAIAEGSDFSLGLRSDGNVVAWGKHWDGYHYVPVVVPADLSNVVAIAAGYDFCLALRNDGTVVAWGENVLGQTRVPADLTDVVAISTGYAHSLALKGDGTVVAWGWDTAGNTVVPTGLMDVVAIAAASFHSQALKSDGTVVTWGRDCEGQRVDPPTDLGNVVAISGGCAHSLALKNDGTIVAWGENFVGQLNVPTGLANVVAISAGETHSLALKYDGVVVAWGANDVGESSVVRQTNVLAIAAGWHHNLALLGEASPAFTMQPSSQIGRVHSGVFFRAVATGRLPLNYQWQFNGTNIVRATNAWLSLKNLAAANGGNYQVLVSNAIGASTSHVASLTVCDFAVSTTRTKFGFNGGRANFNVVASSNVCPWAVENPNTWIVVSSSSNGLGSAVVPCLLTSNRTANTRSGTITVGGKVVLIEQAGVPQRLLPQIARQPKGRTFTTPGGTFTLRVEFEKHPKPILPYTYQWYFNGAAVPGETRARLVLKHIQPSNAGEYHIVVSNPFGDVTSAAATIRFVLDLSNRNPGSRPVPLESRDSLRDYFPEREGATTAAMDVPPVLRHVRAPDGQLILNWDPGAIGFRIQKSFSLIDPDWQDVPESERTNAIKLPITDRSAYFRLLGR